MSRQAVERLVRRAALGICWAILVWLAAVANAADGQAYGLSYFDVSRGLSNNYVTCTVADRQNIRWIATEGGMNRYDGLSLTNYRPSPRYSGLKNENIETLLCDREGDIWVGTKSGGLSRYDPVADTFDSFNGLLVPHDSASVIRVTALEQSGKGELWVATWQRGVFVIDPVERKLLRRYSDTGQVRDILADEFDNVWLSGYNHLRKYDPSEDRLYTLDLPNVGTVFKLCFDPKTNGLLVGASQGLYRFDIGDYSTAPFVGLPATYRLINAIAVDSAGAIWLGSWKHGVMVSDSERSFFKPFKLSSSGAQESNYQIVLDLSFDRNGILWVSTGYGGVVKAMPRNDFRIVANRPGSSVGLPGNNVQCIAKDPLGGLWVGTWSDGAGRSLDGARTFERLPGLRGTKVNCFLSASDRMLVGTQNGLFAYRYAVLGEEPLQVSLDATISYKVTALCLMPDSTLWVGTQQHGLLRYRMSPDGTLTLQNCFARQDEGDGQLKSNRISRLAAAGAGELWVGTYNGLYRYAEGQFERVDRALGLPSVITLDIHLSADGRVWVAMPGGLVGLDRLDGALEVARRYDERTGLANDYVTAAMTAEEGTVWLSNARGLARIAEGETVNFGPESGVALSSMNIGARYDDRHSLYFGGSTGLVVFSPSEIRAYSQPPGVRLAKLRVNNEAIRVGQAVNGKVVLAKSVEYIDAIRLSYQEKVVSFSFVADDHRASHNLRYYYRIDNLQKNWIDNGPSGEISLTGLKHGRYSLLVKATRDGKTFGPAFELDLTITPPWWRSNGAYAAYALALLVAVLLIRAAGIRQTRLQAQLELAQMAQEKEHEMTEAKTRFFTNISHELRTPLTLILSPLSELSGEGGLPAEAQRKLVLAERNAERLLHLINQLLEFRKADSGLLDLQVAEGNFVNFAREIFLSFQGQAEAHKINYAFQPERERLPLTFDRDQMEIVLCNLLSNAFKFTPGGGSVRLSLSVREGELQACVSDNGPGVPVAERERVFDRFFQIKGAESLNMSGSGIGLALSKKIAERHGGTIEVGDAPDGGAAFTVHLPLGDSHFLPDDFATAYKGSESIGSYAEQEAFSGETGTASTDEGVPLLLVVDDNPDIREYLTSLFSGDFSVQSAPNGRVALEMAKEIGPDLVISDVVMPELDGLGLCRQLKEDSATSHVPVILLTARTATVHEVDGLATGADDYVKKPFNAKVIRSRAFSLLENRKKLQSHYQRKVRYETPAAVEPVDFEERFIHQAAKHVEENLDNPNFGVKELAEAVCMSQSTLYRKVKSLTGMSSAGFVRSVRLRKAAEMLLTEDLNLSGVGYAAGFSDYKYFKKSFKQQFGLTPAEYRDQKKEGNGRA